MKPVTRRGRALAALGAASALAAGLVVAVPPVAQAVASVGFPGQPQGTFSGSFNALPTAPTAAKNQHKVWYAAGTWWASMQNAGSTGFSIYRLDGRETGTPVWTDTNVVIDSRDGTSSDAVYNPTANKLFIATHVATSRNTTNLPTTVDADRDAKLMRYSLVDGAWTLDEGFPVKIVGRALSSLAIAQLTDGKIMATYVYGTRPFALSTTTTASGVTPPTFTQPFLVQWTKNNLNNLDLAGSTKLTGDDISAITAADGYATIVFTNQTVGFEGFYAARHRVGDTYGTGNFFGTRLSSGADSADNHISLVTDPTAGATSAVYAVVKTSLDDAIEPNGDPRVPNPADPLLKVMKLQPRSGGTALTVNNAGYVDVTQATISTVANKGTRPVVSLDNSRRALDVFYSAPSDPAASSNVIGVINHKAVDLGTFTPDVSPTVVAANSANNAGVTANQPDGQSDPSVAAQILNKASGTVFVSSDTRVVSTLPLTLARRYWFNDLFRAPSAAFTSVIPTEAGNELGLKVNFTDTSLGRPTSWAWNFGDGGTSTSATPSHTYLSAGSKTVTLTVDNGYQTSTVTKTVVVGQAPQARFTARFPDKQKLLIELTDVSVGAPNSIRWTFGDGTSRTLTTPGAVVRHPYAKAGTYKVTLTVTNPVGSSTVDHPTTKVTTYSFVVNATPAKVAKPTRTALTGRKVVVGWKAPNPRGLVITKYQAICRAPGSVRSTTISAKDGTAALGKARKATVSLLTTGKTYSCTVKSFNAKGWSLPSVASTTFKARA